MITSTDWFKAVELATHHWDRKDPETLVLWFSGYKTQDAYDAETELRKLGGFVLSYDWHPTCGKTAMILKEPKHLRGVK